MTPSFYCQMTQFWKILLLVHTIEHAVSSMTVKWYTWNMTQATRLVSLKWIQDLRSVDGLWGLVIENTSRQLTTIPTYTEYVQHYHTANKAVIHLKTYSLNRNYKIAEWMWQTYNTNHKMTIIIVKGLGVSVPYQHKVWHFSF